MRRIRREWPSFPEVVQAERAEEVHELAQGVRSLQHRTPLDVVGFLWHEIGPGADRTADRKLVFEWWLTPKRPAFPSLDRYYRATITECEKPLRRRQPVHPPTGFFAGSIADSPQIIAIHEAWWWRPQVDLDLLEVALAIRLYRLDNGRFPARLSDVPAQWLPAVPIDRWGQPIAYRLKNGTPLVWSLGPDGRDDGGRPADPFKLSASTQGDVVWGRLTRGQQ